MGCDGDVENSFDCRRCFRVYLWCDNFNFFFFYEMFGCMGIWIKYSLRRIEVLVRERDSVYCLKIQLFSLVFDIQIFINKFIMLSICFFEYIVILI